jgi:predicted short-subunit dehydrogenase-like oxidoreductase (DUF2520 family)
VTRSDPLRIALVGTGNVAWHLGHALSHNGISVIQVLGRNVLSSQELSDELQVKNSGLPKDLDPEADACLICISDDAIPQVLKKMKPGNCFFMHTAGSLPMHVFSGFSDNYGVLYPLQSLTKGRPVNFANIPLLIEANTQDNLLFIKKIADRISRRVVQADSEKRLFFHLAAVFANNFSNHMFALAEKLTLEHGLSFELLGPLIEETASRAKSVSPRKSQTGPALRGNLKILRKHLALLQDHPELQQLYRLISSSIRKTSIE